MEDFKANLVHITHKNNIQPILSEGFEISKHNPFEKKSQWLGDGVYAYYCDPAIIDYGKWYLSKNRYEKDDMGLIRIDVECSENAFLDLDSKKWRSYLKNWAEKVEENVDETVRGFLTSVKDGFTELEKENCEISITLKKIGEAMGYLINFLVAYLKRNGCCIVCAKISTPYKIDDSGLGMKRGLAPQFCIKSQDCITNGILIKGGL